LDRTLTWEGGLPVAMAMSYSPLPRTISPLITTLLSDKTQRAEAPAGGKARLLRIALALCDVSGSVKRCLRPGF
jgi:hypothetical protein